MKKVPIVLDMTLFEPTYPQDTTDQVLDSIESVDGLLRRCVDQASDCVLLHHPDGTLVYWNEAAAMMAGYVGVALKDVPPWAWTKTTPEIREERLHTLRQQGQARFTCDNRTRAGAECHVEAMSRWIETADGPLVLTIERDVSERTQTERVLRDMAFRDPLTGLANRAMLEDRLKLAVADASRHNDVLGVLYLDLDDFKPINDTYGHYAGDRVLRTVALRMEGAVRSSDTVARVGGDEFVVVLPRLKDAVDLALAAKKIRDVVTQPFELDGETACCVTATVGHAIFDPMVDDAHSLLIRADLAMYHARQMGIKVAGAEPLD